MINFLAEGSRAGWRGRRAGWWGWRAGLILTNGRWGRGPDGEAWRAGSGPRAGGCRPLF